MRAGYEEALPLLEQALAALQGTGELNEAYANYNLGNTLLGLGSCDGRSRTLDRSEQIQGERKEITRDRKAAEKARAAARPDPAVDEARGICS